MPIEIVGRFLALLELYRARAVAFDQSEPLGVLQISWTGDRPNKIERPRRWKRQTMSDEISRNAGTDDATAMTGRSRPASPEGVDGTTSAVSTWASTSRTPELDDAELGAVLEALLLVVDTPVTVDALATAIEQPAYRVAAKLQLMAEELAARDSGIDLREAGGGWRMYTRARFAPYVERLLLDGARSKLTRAALETLAVVAYRQPVTRARVSAVRGVNVDAVMRTLLARGLITEAGTDADSGAVAFATTELFLERLGFDVADRPARHRTAAARRRRDRRSQRNTRRRATFHETQWPASPRRRRCPSTWTESEMTEAEGRRPPAESVVAGRNCVAAGCREDDRDGRVEVDGQIVTEMGTRVDPEVSVIRVDGARVRSTTPWCYLAHQQAARHALHDVGRSGQAVRR